MAVSAQYLALVLCSLAKVAPVSYRRIFHGVGLYHQGVQFAIIVHDCVYFRANEASRKLYEERAMGAFRPANARSTQSSFYQLPNDVLDNPSELRYWMRTAVEASEKNEFTLPQDACIEEAQVLQVRAS